MFNLPSIDFIIESIIVSSLLFNLEKSANEFSLSKPLKISIDILLFILKRI